MLRVLFEKTGNAVWISHLDLMRLFQRAFKRAGLALTHTQGFNPRPSVSIALPLSVGVESFCELLDFELDGAEVSCEQIRDRLNECLVSGIRVLSVYNDGKKLKELAFLKCRVRLEYDRGVPENAVSGIRDLFSRDSVVVPKRTKNGVQDQNIIPMIRSLEVWQEDSNTVVLEGIICCQNPTLNPMQLPMAIEMYFDDLKPDFSRSSRIELYDKEENIFR